MQSNPLSRSEPEARHAFAPVLPVLLLGVSTGLGALWFAAAGRVWSQAGYLHLAFARSLAQGTGFGLGSGPVFGDESPLWVALLAGTHLLTASVSPDWMVSGRILAVAAALFWAGGLFAFGYGLLKRPGVPGAAAFAAAIVLLVVASPEWGAVAFSGSEVLLASGVACWGFAAVTGPSWARLSTPRLLTGCLCAGLGPLLRPEMLFFSLCVAPLLFVRWVNTPQRFGLKILTFFAGLLVAVGPAALWLLFTLHTFGTALPNQIAADRAAPGASVLRELIAGFGFGSPWLLAGCFGVIAWLALEGKRQRRVPVQELGKALDFSGWAALVWALLVLILYLAMHQTIGPQEILLVAPAATAAGFGGLWVLRSRYFSIVWPIAVFYGALMSLLVTGPGVRSALLVQQDYAALARALGGIGVPDRVALSPAGEVVFLSGHPVADLSGMLDPSVAPLRWDGSDARRVWWAHGKGSRYMVLDHAPEPGSTLVWSRQLAETPGVAGTVHARATGALKLWRLPPAPTLPEPMGPLPDDD